MLTIQKLLHILARNKHFSLLIGMNTVVVAKMKMIRREDVGEKIGIKTQVFVKKNARGYVLELILIEIGGTYGVVKGLAATIASKYKISLCCCFMSYCSTFIIYLPIRNTHLLTIGIQIELQWYISLFRAGNKCNP